MAVQPVMALQQEKRCFLLLLGVCSVCWCCIGQIAMGTAVILSPTAMLLVRKGNLQHPSSIPSQVRGFYLWHFRWDIDWDCNCMLSWRVAVQRHCTMLQTSKSASTSPCFSATHAIWTLVALRTLCASFFWAMTWLNASAFWCKSMTTKDKQHVSKSSGSCPSPKIRPSSDFPGVFTFKSQNFR